MNQRVLSKKEYSQLVDYWDESSRMGDLLTKDIKKIIQNSVKFESELQFWLRIAVRTGIDSVDAMTYRMKTFTREAIKLRGIQKKLYSKPKKKALILTFKELAVALDSTFEIEEDDENYKDYLKAHKIRDRITHPKKLTDLNISIEEYEKVANAFIWLYKSLEQLIKQSKLSKQRKE